ncbi:MAG TPA: hydantoinase/oxoprolinase family protein, partial [Micromonospora sp.]|nr:hydantoinase/oxoprolinase family protein [Micromonospora sp.]
LDPDRFLAGTMELQPQAARDAIDTQIARPLNLSVEAAAAGIYDVLLAKTVGAVRQITVERGHDPNGFSLLAFGGAGPLLAPLLAREMGIREVVVPFAPSGFSAWGMLSADIVDDFARTVMTTLDDADLDELERLFKTVEAEAVDSLRAQGVTVEQTLLQRQFELRYLGQEHTLMVTVGHDLDPAAIRAAFEEQHRARYGHVMENRLQILNLRVRGIGRTQRPELVVLPRGDGDPSRALIGRREAYDFGSRSVVPFTVYDRSRLAPGDSFAGPALIDEGTSTTVVPSGQRAEVDPHGYLLVTLEEDA